MNKESMKYKLSQLYKFARTTGTKTRYRVTTTKKAVKNHFNRFGIRANRLTQEFTYLLRSVLTESIQFLKNSIIKLYKKILNNKKKVAIGALSFCVFAFCALSILNAMTAYQYSYNGQILGLVDEPESVYAGIQQAEESLTEKLGAQVVIDEKEDIELKWVLKGTGKTEAEEDVANTITGVKDIKVIAYAINIKNSDGEEQQLFVDTEEHANQLLDAVKTQYLGDFKEEDYLEINFEEDITVVQAKSALDDIVTTESGLKTIMSGGVEEKVHIVKVGDSLADIADKYDVSRKKVKKWNPEIGDDNILYEGQEIQLQEQIPLLNVITKRNTIFTEDFGPEIEYTDTDDLYKGQEITTKEGKSGNRTVNADIIEKNGVLIDRIDNSYVVHSKQKSSEVMRGTKERPEKIGKGYYYYPMNGKFSSPFGPRWGRVHQGIDISGPTGTNVYAADAGTVVSAGYQNNGYGIVVEISHGNGRTTFYAHNSEVLVKAGDLVYRGQHIAESGNTGSSTGPHLHFETRFNGVAKNPMKYL